ncbi:hypothetical protein LTS08_000383 [Lithohypha guttulata]|uniref:Sodium/calcium exchanger membrane region domain-containing protein n=1 Tax=Lithohypha guttulata TaxID=1690604 RepID=A0AAN7YDC1_9EURO|nr:hypothetical protein LTR05_003430 [Lithohypha guttulata]KAK5106265.1 hypothetical protein LTS08_000383 [Lithohypha guttulata]
MGGQKEPHNEKIQPSPHNPSQRHVLPTWMEDGRLVTKGVNPEGESGRSGFRPSHFFGVAWRNSNTLSRWVNILWPFVPAAIAVHFAIPERHGTIFAINYIAMIPCANMVGFAGQELARKLPRVYGILVETTLGSVVEIILFLVLATRAVHNEEYIQVLQAAILGSILTNLLLCLGFCFLVGGIKNKVEQKFHSVISETGSGILLVAGFGLLIPSAFFSALSGTATNVNPSTNTRRAEGGSEPLIAYTMEQLYHDTLGISHGTAIILMVAFIVYIFYSAFSTHSVFDEILAQDQQMDNDRHRDIAKKKFTLFECVLAIIISLACVSLVAVFLVEQIHHVVRERHVPEAFLGFILVPLVEKLAEHITAIDEAYDNQINFALYHCIGPSVQTALFNAPLAVIVGWGLGVEISLNFEIFMIVLLVLSILVVGNFLRDGSSNYLEGALLIVVYAIIALATWFYPTRLLGSTKGVQASS